jgi:hypothetical protein
MLTCGIEVQFFPKSLVWDTNFLVSWRKKLVSRGDIDLIRELWWLLDVSLSQKSYARHVHIICRIVHHPIWLAIVPITDGKHPTVGAALEVFPLENQKKIFLVPNMQKKKWNEKNERAEPTEHLGQLQNRLFLILMMAAKMHVQVNITQCCHRVLPDLVT